MPMNPETELALFEEVNAFYRWSLSLAELLEIDEGLRREYGDIIPAAELRDAIKDELERRRAQ